MTGSPISRAHLPKLKCGIVLFGTNKGQSGQKVLHDTLRIRLISHSARQVDVGLWSGYDTANLRKKCTLTAVEKSYRFLGTGWTRWGSYAPYC